MAHLDLDSPLCIFFVGCRKESAELTRFLYILLSFACQRV